MQFNPTDKSLSLIGDIDFLLFGDSTTFNTAYALADRTRNVNIAWDEALSILYRADPNYQWDDTSNTDFPIATLDLDSSLDHYAMLDAAQVIHRVRVKDENGRWNTLDPVLRRELSDSELASTGTPNKYFKLGSSIFPIPAPNYSASGGVELQFQRGGNHFVTTDTTKEAGFNPQFHQFLSVGAALRYALGNGMQEKAKLLQEQKTAIADAMREHYETRSPDERPKLSIKRSRRGTGL